MRSPEWTTVKLNYYAHRYPEALRACRTVLDTITRSNTAFRNHDRLLYWLGKPNGQDDWCDLIQNMLVVAFLHEYCDLLPMTPSEDAFDTSGEPVIYEEIGVGSFWKRSVSVWLHDGNTEKEAYRLWPQVYQDGGNVWLTTDAMQEYSHVEAYWEAYGNYVPEEQSGGLGLNLKAWEKWILA